MFIFHRTEEDNVSLPKEKRGMFISYIELSKYLKGKSVSDGKQAINEMVSNGNDL